MTFDKEFYACFKCKDNNKFIQPELPNSWDEWAKEASQDFFNSLQRQYISCERYNPVLRLSNLGKSSIIELLAKKFGLIKQGSDGTVSEECRLRFVIGDLFEPIVTFMLKRYGFTINSNQEEVDWNGVKGHTDMVVTTPKGERCVLELKTANDRYFKQIKKSIGDERGYLTQLCTYSECLKLPAYWLFMNKNSQELFVKPLESVPEEQRVKALRRAKRVVEVVNSCEEFDEFPNFCKVPPPCIEKYRDGSYKYHDDGTLKMYIRAYSMTSPDLFYVMKEGKTDYGARRNYVYDYIYPTRYANLKPDIQSEAMKYDQ